MVSLIPGTKNQPNKQTNKLQLLEICYSIIKYYDYTLNSHDISLRQIIKNSITRLAGLKNIKVFDIRCQIPV